MKRGPRVGENPRPPRYRLLAAVAANPPPARVHPSASFESDCPACGALVVFTQTHTPDGVTYVIEEHDCAVPRARP